jgi:hypothetical protein
MVLISVFTLLQWSVGPAERIAHATVMALDAADYVPTVANLPAGYIEVAAEAVGGELEPTIALRRVFASLDGSRRVTVDVSLGTAEHGAHKMLDARVNQLVRYHGWRITPSRSFGESGYRGTGSGPDGSNGAMIAFRIWAVVAEVMVTDAAGGPDVPLMDNLARLVERRIQSNPAAVAYQPGWPVEPVRVPSGDSVVGIGAVAVGPGGVVPPGAAVTGSSGGSPIPGDTIVVMTITGLDRPWAAAGSLPRPSNDLEYLTVETHIEVHGQTEVVIALTDFWVSTFDGRSWTPLPGRAPALVAGSAVVGAPSRGWMTFMIPKDQPALQLTWRIRTRQPLTTQGRAEQTLVIPLTVGATASAQVGESAPPAGAPVVPPSSAPTGPTGPSSPSGPSAPTTTSN